MDTSITASPASNTGLEKVTIRGVVTGFDGNQIDSADVMVLEARFEPINQTRTAAQGSYSLEVDLGLLLARAGGESHAQYDRIQVIVTDPESGDRGEALVFARRLAAREQHASP